MGTSLSGLTPATTFDGLLKTSDNDALDATLKTIGTGDGTDSVLQLSNSVLQIGGTFNVDGGIATFKGVGSSSLTSSFIIKNSADAEIFRVRDDQQIFAKYINGQSVSASAYALYGADYAPNIRVNIKGSGATSATTSLLVQNSAGGSVFSVRDDGALLFYRSSNSAELLRVDDTGTSPRLVSGNNANKSLTLGNDTILSSYSSIQFKTHDGAGYSEAMRITGNTDQFVGIGETTPTARLHIKGSGNDNTTTSLLVQNSDAADMLKILDDRSIETYDATGNIITKNNANNRRFEINPDLNSVVDFQVGGGGLSNLIRTDSGLNSVGIGTGGLASTRLVVKGSGATSATTALLVQNSAGTEHLKVTDDGEVNVRQSLYVNHSSVSSRALRLGWGSMYATDNSSELNIGAVYSQNSAPRIHLGGKTRASGADAIQVQTLNGMYIATTAFNEDPSAQLHIKGSGNDATTTALLVQNSDGADMLKVLGNGQISASGDRLTIGDGADVTLRILASGNAAAGNNYIQPLGTPANQRVVVTGNSVATIKAVDLDASNVYIGHGINQTAATGTLSIKGSGATSATTALLVENSAGTEALKVRDDGKIFFNGLNLVIEGKQIYNANTTNGFLKLNSNRLEYSDSSTSGLDSSAALTVTSTTRGFLPPRMTTTERDAISTPAAGLMVYNTTTNKAQCYNGTAWQDLF